MNRFPSSMFISGGVLITILGIAIGVLYEPGKPGEIWSKKEIKVVREKIIHMLDGDQYKKNRPFTERAQEGPRKGQFLFNKDDRKLINRPLPSRAIRLAFHDCVGSWDGEGNKQGCDGCLH